MASVCSLCSVQATHSCQCLPSAVLLCSSHVPTHTRYQGKHVCKQLPVQSGREEVLEWMRAKLRQERASLSDEINMHYCAATAALFQLYSELKLEMENAYAEIEADLMRLNRELESGKEGVLARAYRLATAHIKTDFVGFINVEKEADRSVTCKRLPLSPTPSLLALLQQHSFHSTPSPTSAKTLPSTLPSRSQSVKSDGTQCSHWGTPRTYKSYLCCKRPYACAQCHDQAETHARGALLQEVCVICGENASQGRCLFCSI